MISVNTKIHDRFSLEFKISYKARRKAQMNNFTVNTFIFVPNSLDINASTYSRNDFYKDIRTNIRLITPVFLMQDIVMGDALPLNNLESAMKNLTSIPTQSSIAEYEYQIKMFSAIFKSAFRDQLAYIHSHGLADDKIKLVIELLQDISSILNRYRKLAYIVKGPAVLPEVYNYYSYGDEFMSNLIERELFRLIDKFKYQNNLDLLKEVQPAIIDVLEKERQHKVNHNYMMVNADSPNRNKDFIFRLSSLKKYVESDLFINAKKKRDGVLVEQVYLSIAAGMSMVFATAIAFAFQRQYGNFTMPFFVALVVSYMLKDRIKELMRFYFAQKMSSKYYDNKTTISIKQKEIGFTKEGFDFIQEANIPKEIIKVRNRIPLIEAENRYAQEKIILYRKTVEVDSMVLDTNANYNIVGVVEIVRYNLLSLMRKTDNPEVPLYVLDEDNEVEKIMGVKNYYINIIIQYKHDEEESFKRYRIGFNRDGINSIKEISIL